MNRAESLAWPGPVAGLTTWVSETRWGMELGQAESKGGAVTEHSLRTKLDKDFTEFASSTSAHGFQYTVEGNKRKRILSTLVVIVFCAIAAYFTIVTITNYMNGPGFNSEYNLIYTQQDDPHSLAVFAICDTAPWDFKKAEKASISVEIVSYLSFHTCPFEANHNLLRMGRRQSLTSWSWTWPVL